MKILIIEAESHFLRTIVENLEKDGFACENASDFKSGMDKVQLYDYDCVILDINYNEKWLDLLKTLREIKSDCGIIVVSSLNDIAVKLKSFNLGSDDYITKPLHLSELNARIKSVIRRKKFNGQNVINLNEIQIYPDEFRALAHGQELKLTKGEFRLLLYFVSKRNTVVTKTALAEHLWGNEVDEADSYDFIYSHIKNLRKRLTEKGCHDYIKNVYGIGYNFKVN